MLKILFSIPTAHLQLLELEITKIILRKMLKNENQSWVRFKSFMDTVIQAKQNWHCQSKWIRVFKCNLSLNFMTFYCSVFYFSVLKTWQSFHFFAKSVSQSAREWLWLWQWYDVLNLTQRQIKLKRLLVLVW